MNDNWPTMTEEEKYEEWSVYVNAFSKFLRVGKCKNYSEYCDWMDEWERNLA